MLGIRNYHNYYSAVKTQKKNSFQFHFTLFLLRTKYKIFTPLLSRVYVIMTMREVDYSLRISLIIYSPQKHNGFLIIAAFWDSKSSSCFTPKTFHHLKLTVFIFDDFLFFCNPFKIILSFNFHFSFSFFISLWSCLEPLHLNVIEKFFHFFFLFCSSLLDVIFSFFFRFFTFTFNFFFQLFLKMPFVHALNKRPFCLRCGKEVTEK